MIPVPGPRTPVPAFDKLAASPSPPTVPAPLVAVIMGSKSDWDTMSHAAAVLDDFAVPYVKQVVSAHRTPAWMAEFAQGAEARA